MIEGFAALGSGGVFDEVAGFLGEDVEAVAGVEAGILGTLADVFGEAEVFLGFGGLGDGLVVAEKDVRDHVERGV